ncbi:MAG: acyl-CoA synthetase [Burkholderiales bacterium]
MGRLVDLSRSGEAPRPAWTGQSERSQTVVMRVYAWIALTLGRPAARLILYPITGYFLLFSVRARAASRKYLRKVLRREPRVSDMFRHYHTFASTILDRVFLLKGEYSRFAIRTFNEEIVAEEAARGEGCFLVGAHMGSFEVIRSLGHHARGLDVVMVLYEENGRKLHAVLEAINPNLPLQIIPLGHLDSMLKVERALDAGAFVGMLADRTITGDDTMACSFLSEPARLPVGPFRLAAMLNRPIVLMFGLFRGGNRYVIHFERLADMRGVDRKNRAAVIEQTLRRYVQRLEHYVEIAPYNWFNFYDYWA